MTPTRESDRRERRIIAVIAAVVLVLLMIIGLLTWRSATSTAAAREKADRLIAAFGAAGARTPSQDQVVRLFGDDGGAVCANPNGSLGRATLLAQLANGSGGPGTRPVIVDRRLVIGEALVIGVYCPDQLPAFRQFVTTLKTADLTDG